jgi:hypothetical protein
MQLMCLLMLHWVLASRLVALLMHEFCLIGSSCIL